MNKDDIIKWTLLSTTLIWIMATIGVCVAIKVTGSIWALLVYGFLPTPSLKNIKNNE